MINSDLYEYNSFLMYEYFNTLGIPFKCGRINMWSQSNKYDFVPNFKFVFLSVDKNDIIYKNIESAIFKFQGKLKWQLYTKEDMINFVIKPISINEKYDNEDLREFIDKTIEDIPRLIEHLKKCIPTQN